MPPEAIPPAPMMPSRPRATVKDFVIPAAILVAGIIIALAVYIVRINHTLTAGTGNVNSVNPVTPGDHIVGNPSAPIVFIEYADVDSSYSKSFALTMEQLMTEYAAGGKVAWVYRHFPITDLHPNAATNALAAECAASLGKPDTFFQFIDAMDSTAPGENQFNPNQYSTITNQLGIDQAAFEKCVTAGTYTKKIHDDYNNGLAAGATGSPYIVLLVKGQKPAAISGALPYTAMKKIIDDALTKVPAS